MHGLISCICRENMHHAESGTVECLLGYEIEDPMVLHDACSLNDQLGNLWAYGRVDCV